MEENVKREIGEKKRGVSFPFPGSEKRGARPANTKAKEEMEVSLASWPPVDAWLGAYRRLPRLGRLEDEVVESVPDLSVLANVGV